MEPKTKERKLKKVMMYIGICSLVMVFVLLLKNVLQNRIQEFDSLVYGFIVQQVKGPSANILRLLTHLGGAFFVISITIILICVIKNKKYSICIVTNLMGVTVLNQALKFMIQRPRPDEIDRLIQENGFSFPSGHSMASMAFYGLLMYFAYKNVKSTKLKCGIYILLAIVILLIGISRIYLGVHYASDVLAGFCLSILYLVAFIKLVIPKILK